MSTPTPPSERKCPHCGAVLGAGAKMCWLCCWEFRGEPGETPSQPATIVQAKDVPNPRTRPALQFGLATGLLALTSAAVLLSIFAMSPGLGIVAGILLAPPLVRTCWVASREQAHGTPTSAGDNISIFVQTFVAILVGLFVGGIAAVVAFFAICAFGNPINLDSLPRLATMIGGGVAIAVFFLTAYALWRRWS